MAEIRDDPGDGDPSIPINLANGYLSLYRNAIAVVERDLTLLRDMSAPASVIADVQAELDARRAELEPKIAELETFRAQF